MGVCPNCGNWVDEGDICDCCGGSGSYSYDTFETDLIATAYRAKCLKEQGKYSEALSAYEDVVKMIEDTGPLTSWDSLKSPHMKKALEEIEELKSMLEWDFYGF